jgi:hypothetical protein
MADLSESHGRFWEAIARKGIEAAARDSGGEASEAGIRLSMTGKTFVMDPARRKVFEETAGGAVEAGFFESVVLISYLGTTDGSRDRKSTRLNSSHNSESRMPSSA